MFRVVLVIVALAAGGAAAWLAFAMQDAPALVAEAAPPIPMQDVLVASAEVGRGQVLAKESMRWQSWPEGALNSAYITRSARPDAQQTLIGSIARNGMASGEPIRGEMLLPLNTSFLSATLPPGRRAVAVRISAESTAGGFILPNDRVDVILTAAREGQGEGEKQVSSTILRNVPVLAIDQNVDENSKDDKPKDEKAKDDKIKPKVVFVGKTATLEVDSRQAEILAAGEASGTLSLALRSVADNGETSVVSPSRTGSPPPTYIIRGGSGSVAGGGGGGNSKTP